MTKCRQVRRVKQQSKKDLMDKARWALKNCEDHDEGLGCLICKDLAEKNEPFKSEKRIECPT